MTAAEPTTPPTACTPDAPCRRFVPGEPFAPGRDCRRCWQEHHVPGVVNFGPPARESPPHEGEAAPVQPVETNAPSPSAAYAAGGLPGTRLKELLDEIGVRADGCGACRDWAARMDRWGVEGCRNPANRALVVAHLRVKVRQSSAWAKIRAVAGAVGAGLVLDPRDPAAGLYDEAVRRADAARGTPSTGGEGVAPPLEPHPAAVPVPPPTVVRETGPVRWATAVTTVPLRRADLTPRTIASLAAGGFGGEHRPWLYVDGCDDLQGWRREYRADERDGLVRGVTCRYPLVRAYASWVLALTETFYRDPLADRYAIFQDDVEVPRNLRQYLDTVPLVPNTYWNLWCGPWNENPRSFGTGRQHPPPPWMADPSFVGFAGGDQGGRGAMGLVFDRATVRALLACAYLTERPAHRVGDRWELHPRGFKFIDGGIVEALKPLGYRELVHHPSLVRHVGTLSTVDKRDRVTAHDPNMPRKRWDEQYEGRTFPGTGFDATELIDRRRDG